MINFSFFPGKDLSSKTTCLLFTFTTTRLIRLYTNRTFFTLVQSQSVSKKGELCFISTKNFLFPGNFGGICSLFNGFSFLSLVEVIYFLTIRFFLNLKQNRDDSNQIDSQPRDEPQDRQGQSPYWREMRINTPNPASIFITRHRPNFDYHW